MLKPRLPRVRRRRRYKREIPLPGALGGATTVEVPFPTGLGSGARRFGQELSLAALIGGNLFGRTAMGPALANISEEAERGKVLNSAWRRYGTVNSVALATLVGTWLPTRRAELAAPRLARGEKPLLVVRDVAVGAVVVTGLASAVGGIGFARAAPDGAVPMQDGQEPAPEAPSRAGRLKAAVNVLGALNLCSEVALVAVNVVLLQRRARKLPIR